MVTLTPWREAIAMPIVPGRVLEWNLEELEHRLSEAISVCVQACLQKDKSNIYTTLSGGLDSSFCLAKVHRVAGSLAIDTFTTGGSDAYPDVWYAKIVSDLFDTYHHELIPSEVDIRVAERVLREQLDEEPTPGNVAVFLTYQNMARHGARCVIAHDGIDELLGGYWEHRRHEDLQAKVEAFMRLWANLEKGHLEPLERKARHFGIQPVFPYLQREVVEYISRIPLDERTTREESKIPLRTIASKYLPAPIIERKKKGFCDALNKE